MAASSNILLQTDYCMTTAQSGLKRRHVFYVTGYDPRGPEFYHALLKREARVAKSRGLENVHVSSLRQTWVHGFLCECSAAEVPQLEISYEFFAITDIIAKYFRASIIWALMQSFRLLFVMLASGFLFRNFRRAPKFATFSLYPFVLIFLLILLSLVLAGILYSFSGEMLLAMVGGIALFSVFCFWIRRNDHRFYLFYLLGDFFFSHAVVTGENIDLKRRMQEFIRRVEGAVNSADENTEILIVGHSSGALLAVQLAAEVSRRVEKTSTAKISLLTLGGQSSLGFFWNTESFVADVAQLATIQSLAWRDIFAPQDVICSGRFDAVAQLTQAENKGGYSLHSARFKEALAPFSYGRMRFDFFKLHMQYLRARETDRGFSFLSIIISPMRLAATPI